MYSKPAFNPAIPCAFIVPASKSSGIECGCSLSKEWIPLPPDFNGRIITPFLRHRPPVPCGPNNPLCPVKHSASIFIAWISIGRIPADCDASTIKCSPWRLQASPIRYRFSAVPVTLEACVHTIASVSGRIASSNASLEIVPSSPTGRIVSATPCCSFKYKGRNTELCSIAVVITWSPGCNIPLIAVFSASVAFDINATCSGPSPLKNSLIISLVS